MQKTVDRVINETQPDLIYAYHMRVGNYIEPYRDRARVLAIQNSLTLNYRRLAKYAPNWWRKIFYSIEYYKLINKITRQKLGGIHSAELIMVSVDFGNILPLMEAEKWDLVIDKLITASLEVENGGGEFLVICTNTMHKLADQIAQEEIRSVVINMEHAAFDQGLAQSLAEHLKAPCYTLSELKAASLYKTVREEMEAQR